MTKYELELEFDQPLKHLQGLKIALDLMDCIYFRTQFNDLIKCL